MQVKSFVIVGIAMLIYGNNAYSNHAFDSFKGHYRVVSTLCNKSDSPCPQIKEVEIKYSNTSPSVIIFREIRENQVVDIPLVLNESQDRFGNIERSTTESTQNFASWLNYHEWGMDVGATLESRSVLRLGEYILYSYHYRVIKNADGHAFHFEHHYTLEM